MNQPKVYCFPRTITNFCNKSHFIISFRIYFTPSNQEKKAINEEKRFFSFCLNLIIVCVEKLKTIGHS